MRVAAMATFATEGSTEMVVTAGRHLRAIVVDKDLASLENKIATVIGDSGQLHRKYTDAMKQVAELKGEVEELREKLKVIEDMEMSFSQCADIVDSGTDSGTDRKDHAEVPEKVTEKADSEKEEKPSDSPPADAMQTQ